MINTTNINIFLKIIVKYSYICSPKKGEMLEWLKRHAWKACIRQKRISGSNPDLSARQNDESRPEGRLFFCAILILSPF